MHAKLALLAPALDGPVTGGTIYNAELVAALRNAGALCTVRPLEHVFALIGPGLVLVDSLYLAAMPELRRRLPDATLGLLLHYLPSLVASPKSTALSPSERAAVEAADFLVVTGPFLHERVRPCAGHRPLACVEPGASIVAARTISDPRPAAVMLCSVIEAKGVLSLLEALAARTKARDAFSLRIAGRIDLEPAYTRACRALVERDALLRSRVELLGPLAHERALELLANASALLSASRMESYAMALAEARATGVPILATPGGHAAAHVREKWGGALAADAAELAERWLELVRDPRVLAARKRAASAHRSSRSWDDAAAELRPFLAGLLQRGRSAS